MTRRVAIIAVLVAASAVLAGAVASAADPDERPRWDTRLIARVSSPGFPAHAYVHPNGRIYAGTYVNPSGDAQASRVFEYTARGTLLRSWTIGGQALDEPHGIQVATSDARGRLVILDRSPARALLLNRANGALRPYATFADLEGVGPPTPNFAAWGRDGSLYVTDYLQGVIWRVPRGGGEAELWLDDPRLAGGEFGTTGIELTADRRTLLISQQTVGGELIIGGLFRLPINRDGSPGALQRIWTSGPMDLADGVAIARSGRIYVALVGPNQVVALDADGTELERFPELPITGENGSEVPFDSLSSVGFRGRRLITASQSVIAGDPQHWALHDVWVGERGIPEFIPRAAGR